MVNGADEVNRACPVKLVLKVHQVRVVKAEGQALQVNVVKKVQPVNVVNQVPQGYQVKQVYLAKTG
jgi:hypothetical protein